MQEKEHTNSQDSGKPRRFKEKIKARRTEISVIWFVVTMLLVALLAISSTMYVVSEVQKKGNCYAAGGMYIKHDSHYVCIDRDYFKKEMDEN